MDSAWRGPGSAGFRRATRHARIATQWLAGDPIALIAHDNGLTKPQVHAFLQ